MAKLSLEDLDLKNKKVLMRVDFNVPLDKSGNITDDTRIKASLPSIEYLINHGAKIILISHLGSPKGKIDPYLSLKPIADRLQELLNRPVLFLNESIGEKVHKSIQQMKNGEVILLENLRFHPEEEKQDPSESFAKELATFADIYVNDAFGSCHRKHASIVTLPKFFKGCSVAGFLVQKELKFFDTLLKNPKRPFFAVIGGSKVSSKLGVLKALLKVVDKILIAGGMAYTFLKAEKYRVGQSIVEDDLLLEASSILQESKRLGVEIVLPLDHVVTNDLSGQGLIKTVETKEGIDDGFYGVDIGEKTISYFSKILQEAKTVFWNGPLGIFEIASFSRGTKEIAKVISSLKATTVVGGGDSIAALEQMKLTDKISHVSTGGGASLEFIELGSLPGIDVLTEKTITK